MMDSTSAFPGSLLGLPAGKCATCGFSPSSQGYGFRRDAHPCLKDARFYTILRVKISVQLCPPPAKCFILVGQSLVPHQTVSLTPYLGHPLYVKGISHWAGSSSQFPSCVVEPGTPSDVGIIVGLKRFVICMCVNTNGLAQYTWGIQNPLCSSYLVCFPNRSES